MKRLSALVLAFAVIMGGYSQAQAAGGTRIGVIRIQEVFRKSEYAKQMETHIRASFRQEEQEIEDLQKVIRTETEKLQTETFMSPDTYAYKDKVLQIKRLELKLQDKVENFRKLTRTKMANFWRSVYADFRAAIKSIASSGQFDLILTSPDFNLSEASEKRDIPEAVMGEILQRRIQYVNASIDITQRLIDTMNAINRKRGTMRNN